MNRLAFLALFLVACTNNVPSDYACAEVSVDLGSGCVLRPADPVTRTECGLFTDACDTSGQTTPSLTCLAAISPPPPTSVKLAMTGFIDVLASGPDTANMTVAVYDVATLSEGTDPTQLTPIANDTATFYGGNTPCDIAYQDANGNCEPVDATTLRACDTDVSLGCTQPVTENCATDCADGLNGRPDKQKYCYATATGSECRDRLRWQERYNLKNVPSDQAVAILVTGENGEADPRFVSALAWNVIATQSVSCSATVTTNCFDTSAMTYRQQLMAVSQADFLEMPQQAGEVDGVLPTLGAIIGEVHDCTGVRVMNAQVSTIPTADRIAYFYDGTPQLPVIDQGRAALGTDARGLYAAFNITPGTVTVIPWGYLQPFAPLQMIDATPVTVYANVVTLLNLDGGHYDAAPNNLPPGSTQ